MNDKTATETMAADAGSTNTAIATGYRPLRTINLVEQRSPAGRITWVLIEGNTTLFDMNEAELLHATSRQLFGVQTNQIADTVGGHSERAFQFGVNCGHVEERHAAQERARAAREAAVPTGGDPDPADAVLRTRGRDRKTKASTITKRATKVAARKPSGKKKAENPTSAKRRR